MLVVFSDMHLTNHWFNPKKLRYLTDIIESADQVAIDGDFWDGFRCSFDQFIKSPWRVLFPLLKSKEAIYIYGNHDLEEWCDWRVNLFSVYQAVGDLTLTASYPGEILLVVVLWPFCLKGFKGLYFLRLKMQRQKEKLEAWDKSEK